MSPENIGIIPERQQLVLESLLKGQGLDPAAAELTLLAGDGSDRIFLRLTAPGWQRIAVLPSPSLSQGLREAESFWLIGRHLRACGVPVPELYGFDRESGLVLCEDLGDTLLHLELQKEKAAGSVLLGLYRQALDLLLNMQLRGAVDFDPAWCWDTAGYDRALMLERESGYFREACCRNLLGLQLPSGLEDEFRDLAELAGGEPSGFFLHRDFQSRNLLVQGDNLRVLDFQGGRLGPLAYDLASLLNDPYAALPETVKMELFEYYRANLDEARPDLRPGFSQGYLWLALQRNLQILGAFAFLSGVKGKIFFRGYLRPAAENLARLLEQTGGQRFPLLRALAAELPERLDLSINS